MPAELPPQIIDPEDYKEHLNIMIFGATGCGKTVMAAQLPKILILAVEPGTISAVRWMKKHRPKRRDYKIWNINTWGDLTDAYAWLRDSLEEGTCPFEWVMIDTVTKAQYRDWRAIMKALVERAPHRDEDVPDKGEHFKMQLTMKRMVSDFNELPINIVWTAQPMNADLEGEDEERVIPMIEGKDGAISAALAADMDDVWYLRRMRVKKRGADSAKLVRRLYTEHHIYWVKDRFDCLPKHIDDPDINQLVKTIRDAEERPTPTPVRRRTAKKTTAKKTARARRAS